ncbi:MAG: winged helix-turn-helix domain-containing protein [Aggregatilineales bacterium]
MKGDDLESGRVQPDIEAEFVITSLETLKVFSDPLRQQIIETLLDGPRTVKQIAAELNISPNKLYYHVNLLEAHSLIQVTDTRIVSGIIEKQYRASARHFAIERTLLSPGGAPGGLSAALDALLLPLREDILRGVASGLIQVDDDAKMARRFRIWRALGRMTEAEATAFYARLEALIEEFEATRPGRRGEAARSGQNYALLIGIAPVAGGAHPETSSDGAAPDAAPPLA